MKIITIIFLSIFSICTLLFAYVKDTEVREKQYQLDFCNNTLELSLNVSDSLIYLKNDTILILREELNLLKNKNIDSLKISD